MKLICIRINGRLAIYQKIRKKYIQNYIKNGSVGGLFLCGSPILYLPNNLKKIGGDLDLSHSSIRKLPENLEIKGGLNISECKNLLSFPESIHIGNGFIIIDFKTKKRINLPLKYDNENLFCYYDYDDFEW